MELNDYLDYAKETLKECKNECNGKKIIDVLPMEVIAIVFVAKLAYPNRTHELVALATLKYANKDKAKES